MAVERVRARRGLELVLAELLDLARRTRAGRPRARRAAARPRRRRAAAQRRARRAPERRDRRPQRLGQAIEVVYEPGRIGHARVVLPARSSE